MAAINEKCYRKPKHDHDQIMCMLTDVHDVGTTDGFLNLNFFQ